MLAKFATASQRTLAALLLAAACVACMACSDSTTDPGTARGRALLAQYQCGRCHTIPGVAAARGTAAVTLEHIGARSYIAGRVPNSEATLAAWIVDPPALVPGTTMPRLGVGTADARAMAAYLATLR